MKKSITTILVLLTITLVGCFKQPVVNGEQNINQSQNTNVSIEDGNKKDSKNEEKNLETYQNKLWGIEFKYPDNKGVVTIDGTKTPITVEIIADNSDYKNILYIMPSAINSDIVSFDDLKKYLDEKEIDNDPIIFKNTNNISFYKTRTGNYKNYVHCYAYYNGKKPHNYIKIDYIADSEREELFDGIVNSLKFIERDEELLAKLYDEKNINPECAGWYKFNEYYGKNSLKKLSEIGDISGKDGYLLFRDDKISFYLPQDWKVEKNGYNKNEYTVYFFNYSYVTITINDIKNFKNDYEMCIDRCFSDAEPTSFFSWKSFECSENYSVDNLDKFLSGNFINYLSTGSLPPGGSGSFIYSKSHSDKVISLFNSSENFSFYPKSKELYDSKSFSEMSKEEKRIISDEVDYYEQEFYKILKSIEIR